MSNETDNNNIHINSSFDSHDIGNNNPKDNNVNSPNSRLSSASKRNNEQRSELVNKSSNETHIKSSINSHQNTNQLSNHKLTNENQSSLDSLNHEEQPTFNNHSSSSFHVDEINNDQPTIDKQNLTKHSIDVNTDDEEPQSPLRKLINPAHTSNYLATLFFPMHIYLYFYIECFRS
jgi:hypothetical protein